MSYKSFSLCQRDSSVHATKHTGFPIPAVREIQLIVKPEIPADSGIQVKMINVWFTTHLWEDEFFLPIKQFHISGV